VEREEEATTKSSAAFSMAGRQRGRKPRQWDGRWQSRRRAAAALIVAMDGGGYSPRFQRQASCSCAPSISRRGFVRAGFDLDGDDDYDYDVAFHSSSSSSSSKVGGPGAPYYSAGIPRPSARARLRALWRRIMREEADPALLHRLHAGARAGAAPYDAYSYAQNFDDGEAWVEPDNLSRSFSARFVVPSRVFQRVAV